MGTQLSIPVRRVRWLRFEVSRTMHMKLCGWARSKGGTLADQLYQTIRPRIPSLPDERGIRNDTTAAPWGALVIRIYPSSKAIDIVEEHCRERGFLVNDWLQDSYRAHFHKVTSIQTDLFK